MPPTLKSRTRERQAGSAAVEEGLNGTAAARVLSQLRSEHGWTLADVSARTGVSISTLSKIENNQTSPAYGVLTRLAAGLDIDFVQLIGGPASQLGSAARAITAAGTGVKFGNAMGEYEVLAADLASKIFQPMLIELPPRKSLSRDAYSSHKGEEFVYVIKGTVKFLMEPYAPKQLEIGDSVYFDGSKAHGFIALNGEPATILSVCLASRSDITHMELQGAER